MTEEILVRMGLDQKALVDGLRTVGGKVKGWARDTADITNRQFARMGQAFIAAFSINRVISNLRTVSAEIDKLYKNIDSQRYKQEQRNKQLGEIGKGDLETIIAGDIQTSNLTGRFNNWLAKAAGLYAFAGSTLSEAFGQAWKRKDPLELVFGLGAASVRAAEKQQQIIEGVQDAARAAAAEQQTTEQKKEAAQKRADYWRERYKAHSKHIEDMEKAQLKRQEQSARYREKELELSKKIASAKNDELAATINLATADRDRSASTLEEIANSTEGFWRYNPLRFRREWAGPPGQGAAREVISMMEEAKRAELWNDPDRAAGLRSRADELRRNIPGLSLADRDPLGGLRDNLVKQQLEVNAALKTIITPNGLTVVPPE